MSAMSELPKNEVVLQQVYVWELPVRFNSLGAILLDHRLVSDRLLYWPSLHQRSGRGERSFRHGDGAHRPFLCRDRVHAGSSGAVLLVVCRQWLCAPHRVHPAVSPALAQPLENVFVLFLHQARSRRIHWSQRTRGRKLRHDLRDLCDHDCHWPCPPVGQRTRRLATALVRVAGAAVRRPANGAAHPPCRHVDRAHLRSGPYLLRVPVVDHRAHWDVQFDILWLQISTQADSRFIMSNETARGIARKDD